MDQPPPRSGILASPLLLAMLATYAVPVEAQIHTLTSGNSTVEIDPSTIRGVQGWIVDGVPQLAQQWYWLRLGSSGPEIPLNSLGPPLVTGVGSTVRFDYGGVPRAAWSCRSI